MNVSSRPLWGRPRLLKAGLVFLGVAVVITTLNIPSASASHADLAGNRRHVRTIHQNTIGHGAADEDYCVETDGSVPLDQVRNTVNNTLSVWTPHWDAVGPYGDWRLDFYLDPNRCTAYTAQQRSDMFEMQYRLLADTSPAWACNGRAANGQLVNCTMQYEPIWEGSHTHYRRSISFLLPSGLNQQIINHETGHSLGLLDPTETDGDPVNRCQASIMHLRWYVGDCAWGGSTPTQSDFDKVRFVVANP